MPVNSGDHAAETPSTEGNRDKINEKETSNSEKPVSLDDVLKNELGQFGRFQLLNILLMTIPIMLSACKTDYIFTAAAIPHRCQISECGEYSKVHTYKPEWILNAVPEIGSGFSACQKYAGQDIESNGTLDYCPASLFNQSITITCERYVYARNNTVVYDFNLGCQEWLRALAGTFSSIGILLGLPISGYISDNFGRKITLIFNIVTLGAVGIVRTFSINYTMFMILQMAQTLFGASAYTSAYILATELIGPKYRVITSATLTSMFSVGEVILGGMAWLIQPWRYLTLALCAPCLLIIVYYWILSESIRWLLSKRKYSEAKKILQTAARINKTTFCDKSVDALINLPQITQSKVEKTALIKTILRSPILLRRVCTVPIWWIAGTFTYYGLSINSTSLSNTIYLNYMLVCAVEIPGFYTGVLFLDRIGRKATLSLGFFFSALCNLMFVFIPNDLYAIRLLTFLLGKFGISMVMSTLYLFTSELYPTEFRQTLLAFSSMIGRIGAITAPLTPVFTQYWYGLPSVMFSGIAVIAGLLVLTQPETLGTKLPDTLAEAEALGK